MAYFGEAYMGRRRQQWLRSLAYVEAQTNGTWHRGTINQKKIEGENVVVMATFPTLDSIACTINASRLIDTYGEQAAYQQRTINKVAGRNHESRSRSRSMKSQHKGRRKQTHV